MSMKWRNVALFEIRLPPPWRPWEEVIAEAERRHPGWSFQPCHKTRVGTGEGQWPQDPTKNWTPGIEINGVLPVVHEGGAVTYTLLGEK